MQKRDVQLRNGQRATIRAAAPEDAVALLGYLDEVTAETDFLTMGEGKLDRTEEKERQFIEDHRKTDNKLLILAEIEGQIAGVLGYPGDDRQRLRHAGEFGITVSRAHWGLGLGTALLRIMIEWAKASRIVRKINMRVRADNERALGLYKRFGFVREGVITRQFAVADTFYDAYLMGLEIDP